MLGTIDRDHVSRLIDLLAADDAAGVIAAVAEIDAQFPDYARLLEDLSRVLQQIAVHQVVGAIRTEDDIADAELARLAGSLPAEDVQLFYQIAILGRRDLHLAPDPRSGAEMTLLRMLSFRPATAAGGGCKEKISGKVTAAQKTEAKAVSAPKVAHAEPASPAPVSVVAWQEPDWGALVAEMSLPGAVRLLAGNCAYLKREGNTVFLSIDPRSESLLTRPRKEALANALSDRFGEALVVDIAIGVAADETPLQEETRRADEKIEQAIATLEADPNVKSLKDMFGAELKTDSIEFINTTQND
jgi:DNA polymerase-3 subunit gamma/tau